MLRLATEESCISSHYRRYYLHRRTLGKEHPPVLLPCRSRRRPPRRYYSYYYYSHHHHLVRFSSSSPIPYRTVLANPSTLHSPTQTSHPTKSYRTRRRIAPSARRYLRATPASIFFQTILQPRRNSPSARAEHCSSSLSYYYYYSSNFSSYSRNVPPIDSR